MSMTIHTRAGRNNDYIRVALDALADRLSGYAGGMPVAGKATGVAPSGTTGEADIAHGCATTPSSAIAHDQHLLQPLPTGGGFCIVEESSGMNPVITTATQIDRYSQAHDMAWIKLEEAIVAMQALNDTLWDKDGETLLQRAPRADVSLLRAKVKELTGEMGNFESVQEPSRLSPVLPGELRF